jgi:hypothetical protein
MRFIRLSALVLLASFALTACASPTAPDNACSADAALCGFPTTGN